MRFARRPAQHLLSLIGTGLVLVSLFGCLSLPTVSLVDIEPTAYQDDRFYRDNWGPRDPWEPWQNRSYRRRGYALPDRYTIHKGKKCELRCERIRGTRDYRCREYRC
jgi:hypothetical protein